MRGDNALSLRKSARLCAKAQRPWRSMRLFYLVTLLVGCCHSHDPSPPPNPLRSLPLLSPSAPPVLTLLPAAAQQQLPPNHFQSARPRALETSDDSTTSNLLIGGAFAAFGFGMVMLIKSCTVKNEEEDLSEASRRTSNVRQASELFAADEAEDQEQGMAVDKGRRMGRRKVKGCTRIPTSEPSPQPRSHAVQMVELNDAARLERGVAADEVSEAEIEAPRRMSNSQLD